MAIAPQGAYECYNLAEIVASLKIKDLVGDRGDGPMQILHVQDVIKMLREEVERAGGQSEFARQKGVQRPLINKVLSGDRLPPLGLCRALALEWVLVRQNRKWLC